MVTRKDVFDRAQELGITIDDNGWRVQLSCPQGYWFHGMDVDLSMPFIYDDGSWRKSEIWAFVMEDYLQGALEKAEY